MVVASSPMTPTARVDELRAKFALNPRRYFAPLANEYRKIGALAESIALCESQLPKLPGHMSGHIVFGQALFDAGRRDEARTVFEQALALDPENLIALRYLGDIAWAVGDAATARRWYERVLEADPRNDDIAAQLETLGVPGPLVPRRAEVRPPKHPTPSAPAFNAPLSADMVADASPATPLQAGALDGAWEGAQESDGWFPLPAGATLPEQDPFAFPDLPGGVLAGSAEAADWLESVHAAAEAPEDPMLAPVPFEEGLEAPVWTDSAALIERTPERPSDPSATVPTGIPTAGAPAGTSAAEAAAVFGHERFDAVIPHAAPVEAIEPEPYFMEAQAPVPQRILTPVTDAAPVVRPMTPPAPAAAVPEEPALEEITRLFQEDARAAGEAEAVRVETRELSPPALSTRAGGSGSEPPAAFVTETMAELLIAQGLLDRGIAIYEELVRQRPSESWLAERLAAVRAMGQQAPAVASDTTPTRVPTARQWWSTLASRSVAAPSRPSTGAATSLAELFGEPDRLAPPDPFAAAFATDAPVAAASPVAPSILGAAGRLTPAAATDLAHFSAWLKDAAT